MSYGTHGMEKSAHPLHFINSRRRMNSLLIILFIMIRRSLRPNRGAENRRETTDTASGMNMILLMTSGRTIGTNTPTRKKPGTPGATADVPSQRTHRKRRTAAADRSAAAAVCIPENHALDAWFSGIQKSRSEQYEVRSDVVPVTGIEPVRLSSRDFKSRASANSATPAWWYTLIKYHSAPVLSRQSILDPAAA